MKKEFERNLNQYGELIKDFSKNNLTPEEEAKLTSAYEWLIEKNARKSGTTEESQKRIFEQQIVKQGVMMRLKRRLEHLEEVDFEQKGKDQVQIKSKNGRYYLDDGTEVTRGQLLTDGEWGVDYYLDPESVPKNVRKRFYLEEAKREILGLLDSQITKHETSKESNHEFLRGAYERRASTVEMPGGICAEKMVSNFLRKLVYDQGADFKIMDGDAFQDVEQKLDFIIRANVHYRGVEVEEGQKAVGIQFTINNSPERVQHKQNQVARSKRLLQAEDKIQDIVLVVLPLVDSKGLVNRWKRTMKPGGPDELWPTETKRRILEGLMAGILTKEEIDRLAATFQTEDRKKLNRAA